MAGFNLDSQKGGLIPGAGPIEMGTIDFSANARTVEVPTRMTTCWCGFAIADSTQPVNGVPNLIATTDSDISNGNITFTRHGSYMCASDHFHYVLFGW